MGIGSGRITVVRIGDVGYVVAWTLSGDVRRGGGFWILPDAGRAEIFAFAGGAGGRMLRGWI